MNMLNHITRRCFSMTHSSWSTNPKLRIAVIGQSMFGADTYNVLKKNGHEVVGVFTIPDIDGKEDVLATAAKADNVPVFKFKRWRLKGKSIPKIVDQYKEVGAELNVMPFCSQFIPMDVIDHPKHGSIVYHPSILPKHRGASAINWTLMSGSKHAGFTIFFADDGLDTGPVLLQRKCPIKIDDTLDDVYNRFLYPEGVKAMGEAVHLVAAGKAPKVVQNHDEATYEHIMTKEKAKIDWNQSALDLHNFIRGNDKVPGAWCTINNEQVTLYGSSLYRNKVPEGEEVQIEGLSKPGIVHKGGLVIQGTDGCTVNIKNVQMSDGRMVAAKDLLNPASSEALTLTPEELQMQSDLNRVWQGIISREVTDDTDFFKAGAGSMDVVRLVEEIKQTVKVIIKTDDVYMNTTFGGLMQHIIKVSRGLIKEEELEVDYCEKEVLGMNLKMPHQLFINNRFVNSSNGNEYDTINPANESVICKVSKATNDDVDEAVMCAKEAFEEGPWATMNPRDRGELMHKIADLMEEHQEELAAIESIDSGAVYTLALKTHVGMSIQTFRYFAGWCDKIHGKTIPINNAHPNFNLTYTKREPLGVCAIVIPWNYPLMMLAWKMASCLAAGNTVVLKPAQVTPLTALKFAELAVKAGVPKGVINILPGSGSLIGQHLSEHPDIRKLGFTGSTPVGKTIMKSCASNLKKVSLELGGKSPLIIFNDCDMDKAVRFGMSSVFFNKGENCIAAGRLFVESSIHDEFIGRILEEIKKMKIGNPLDASTDHGPQNHRAHLEKLVEYCETAVNEGATLIYGGKQCDMPGLYMTPTVITDVHDHMWVAQEESFGPIMVISKFDDGDIDGVLKSANAVEYGLASGVFTENINKAMYVSKNLDAGTVFVNVYNKTDVAAPFGGFKQSGFGKDLGEEALNEYLKTKTVTVEYGV